VLFSIIIVCVVAAVVVVSVLGVSCSSSPFLRFYFKYFCKKVNKHLPHFFFLPFLFADLSSSYGCVCLFCLYF